ncbi:glycosyltransferase [bacterium]|jgi:spore maturation protein CgeB|nr:glycosyltransferase [bacterium]
MREIKPSSRNILSIEKKLLELKEKNKSLKKKNLNLKNEVYRYQSKYYNIINSRTYLYSNKFLNEFIRGNIKQKLFFTTFLFSCVYKRLKEYPFNFFSGQFQKKIEGQKNNFGINVAVIMDEFSFECFKYEANLIVFEPYNWKRIFNYRLPDLLFVESSWSGFNGTWEGKIYDLELSGDSSLKSLVEFCRSKKIKTVFWNKEDPVNYHRFISAAKLFDFVFTTDASMIPFYKRDLGHSNVDVLQFAAQPKIHNPMGKMKSKQGEVCFAGSYYAFRHPERKKNMDLFFDVARNYKFHIFDRCYNISNKHSHLYKFPDKYNDNIIGSIKYFELAEEYKKYDVFLNVNSSSNSETMFSRRVFELLACGTSVLSSPSVGIEKEFGGIVYTCHSDKAAVKKTLDVILSDKEEKNRRSVKGIRQIFEKHTYKNRIEKILKVVSMSSFYKKENDEVSVVMFAKNGFLSDENIKNYLNQTIKRKELIIVSSCGKKIYLDDKVKRKFNISTYCENSNISKGLAYNIGCDVAKYKNISFFVQNDYYSKNYLKDMIFSKEYSESGLVLKGTFFDFCKNKRSLDTINLLQEYSYCKKPLDVSTILLDKFLLKSVNYFKDIDRPFYNLTSDLLDLGVLLYSSDKYNYIRNINCDNNLNFENFKKGEMLNDATV